MVTLTATEMQKDFSRIRKRVIKDHETYCIHNKLGEDIVLMSKEEYDSLQETIYLQSQPGFVESLKQGEKEIENGEYYTLAEVFEDYE